MPVRPRAAACGPPGAASDGAPREPPGRVTARKKRQSAAGSGAPGTQDSLRDGESPSRAGPGPGPSPGGSAGGWDSPSTLAAAGTGTEEPSPAAARCLY